MAMVSPFVPPPIVAVTPVGSLQFIENTILHIEKSLFPHFQYVNVQKSEVL